MKQFVVEQKDMSSYFSTLAATDVDTGELPWYDIWKAL